MPALMAIIGGNANALQHEFQKVEHAAAHLGGHLKAKLAGAISVGAIEEVARHTIEYAEQVSILSQRLGIGTEAIQQWDYALKQNGSSIQDATGFFEKLAIGRKKATDGDEKMTASFRALGISIDDLRGKRLEEIAAMIAKIFQSGDPQKLVADLREVGGRGAGEMIAAFRSGLADELNAAPIISDDVIQELREVADAAKEIWAEIVSYVAPALASMADAIKKSFRGWQAGFEVLAGYLADGSRGAKMAADEILEKFKKLDDAAEKRRANRTKPGIGGYDPEVTISKKAESEIERLHKKFKELQDERTVKAMSQEDRLAEYRRRKEKSEDEAFQLEGMPGKEAEKLKYQALIEAEENSKKIREEQKAPKRELIRGHLTSLQQAGAYTAPGQVTLIDVNKKMEGHLRVIKEKVMNGKGFGGVRH